MPNLEFRPGMRAPTLIACCAVVACGVALVVSRYKAPVSPDTPAVSTQASAPAAGTPNIDVLTSFNVSQLDQGEVHAEGTWTTPDGKPSGLFHSQVNAVQIFCRSETRTCVESIAQVIGANPGLLRVDQIDYAITSWIPTTHEITAVLPQICVTSTLTINLATREVLRITRKGGTSPGTCRTDPEFNQLYSKPLIETLTDWNAIHRDR